MNNIKELLKILTIKDSIYLEKLYQTEVESIAYHSAKVKQGDLFVAIQGYKTDGHKYLAMAAEKGAVLAVVQVLMPEVDIPQIRVEDSRLALALLGGAYFNHPSEKMKMIGITATNGKTTTSYMINEILEGNHLKTGLIGTVVIKSDQEIIPSELTTPESLDLQGHLDHMEKMKVQAVTMEISSSALELKRVAGINYQVAVFNNISREHIDIHGTFENYFNVKASLIRSLIEESFAILNSDNKMIEALKNDTAAKVVTYSVEDKSGDLTCENLDLSTGIANFDISLNKNLILEDKILEKGSYHVELGVPGFHSVYNAMSAFATGLVLGIEIPVIQKALKKFQGVERRFELIFEDQYKIFDDHFANAGNIDVTLGTLKRMDYNHFILVYAIRGSRGPIVNRENAEAIAKWSKILGFDTVIATKSVSHTTEKDRVTPEEINVLLEVLGREGVKVVLHEELKDSMELALNQAKEDDVILLAGCQGMDYGASVMLKSIAERRKDLPEKELFKPLQNRVCGVD